MLGLVAIVSLVLWLWSVAQLIYVPIWATRLRRSGAIWFMLTMIWSGAFAAVGWLNGLMALYLGAFLGWAESRNPFDMRDARQIAENTQNGASIGLVVMMVLPGVVSLLPTLVLAIAGRDKNAPPTELERLRARRKKERKRRIAEARGRPPERADLSEWGRREDAALDGVEAPRPRRRRFLRRR